MKIHAHYRNKRGNYCEREGERDWEMRMNAIFLDQRKLGPLKETMRKRCLIQRGNIYNLQVILLKGKYI